MKISIAKIKRDRAHIFGWAHYKRWLIRQGVIKSMDDDCPVEWQQAFKKANGR